MSKLIFIFSLLLVFGAPFVGSTSISLEQLLHNSFEQSIFFELRLPRVLLAFFAGAILSLAGLLLQSLFRNDLMSPYTLGISSGAILASAISIALGISGTFLFFDVHSIFGFLGAMFSSTLLLFLAKKEMQNSNTILLLGIALSFLYTALLMFIYFISSSETTHQIILYTLGSLSTVGYKGVYVTLFASLILLLFLHVKRYELQIFASSLFNAESKGINSASLSLQLLLVSSFSVGLLVSITGPIGFVGLVVPHLIKQLYKKDITHIIGVTFYYGGVFMIVCDAIARVLSTHSDIPIGVITSLIGGIFFVYLLTKSR